MNIHVRYVFPFIFGLAICLWAVEECENIDADCRRQSQAFEASQKRLVNSSCRWRPRLLLFFGGESRVISDEIRIESETVFRLSATVDHWETVYYENIKRARMQIITTGVFVYFLNASMRYKKWNSHKLNEAQQRKRSWSGKQVSWINTWRPKRFVIHFFGSVFSSN